MPTHLLPTEKTAQENLNSNPYLQQTLKKVHYHEDKHESANVLAHLIQPDNRLNARTVSSWPERD